jgi:nickel-dependent lactate racemase
MTDPLSKLGEWERNPARQDVEEMGRLIGVHFALNAVLNDHKEIVQALAGQPSFVMEAGIPLSRQICQVGVKRRYGLVIASPGGKPKDINVYQAQKGLYHACLVAQPRARLLLAAACSEGSGSRSYEAWMQGKRSYAQVLETFAAEGFRVGPHKAYQIARDASQVRLSLLSEMPRELSDALLFDPIGDWQAAVDEAVAGLPAGEAIAILPHASSTIPYLDEAV